MTWLTGERALAVAFAALGVLFAVNARELRYMDEFAPGAGFLPFWLGLLLVGLVIVFVFKTRAPKADKEAPLRENRKVLVVTAGLAACVALIDWLGFAVPMAAYLLYLTRGVDRRGWGSSIALSVSTTLCLYLVFRMWLGVPLPKGPWGF